MKKSIFTFAFALVLGLGSATASTGNASISSKIPMEKLTKTNLSSFCKAIIAGNYEMVEALIEMGEDIDQKSLGRTPAMYAARHNKSEILSLLIKKGADLSIKSDVEKQTAQQLAKTSNAKESLAVFEKLNEKKIIL